MNEGFAGEPMSMGASGKARGADLEIKFTDAIDMARVRGLLNLARERVGAPVERVQTLNLVGVHYSDASWEKSWPGLEAVSVLHPARIVGLIALPNEKEASITARVAVLRPNNAPFFVERIVMRATGAAVRRLDSSIDGLLVPDVPTVVVWGGRAEGHLLRRAISTADRVIVDSGTRPLSALPELNSYLQRGAPVGDLAWARIFPWQVLAAEVLDIPNLREHRGNLRAATVTTQGPPGPEALLLAGWFQSRVRRAKVQVVAGAAQPEAAPPAPGPSASSSNPPPPAPEPLAAGQIIELAFEAPPAHFKLQRNGGILEAQVRGDDDGELVHRLRLPPDTPGALLAQEMKMLAGCDDIYSRALDEAAKLANTVPQTGSSPGKEKESAP